MEEETVRREEEWEERKRKWRKESLHLLKTIPWKIIIKIIIVKSK